MVTLNPRVQDFYPQLTSLEKKKRKESYLCVLNNEEADILL